KSARNAPRRLALSSSSHDLPDPRGRNIAGRPRGSFLLTPNGLPHPELLMNATRWRFLTGLLAFLVSTLSVAAADPIPADQFARVSALIKPTKDEDKWAQIPWRTSLWQARQQAAARGKPILLWEMDGHPLGCT